MERGSKWGKALGAWMLILMKDFMLEHLFGSKTRVKLLRVLFRDDQKKYFVRELTRLAGVQINAVRRELAVLGKAGLVLEVAQTSEEKKTSSRLRKYYRVNKASLLYPEMHSLLMKAKLLEEQVFIQSLQDKGGKIDLLLLTGRFTGDKKVPSDILLVGDIKEKVVAKLVSQYEKEFGFDIRYTIFSKKEFADRRHIMDKFLYQLFEAKHIKIVDLVGI